MEEPPRDPPAKNPTPPKPKRPRGGWVGPLFRWELVRLARRGQDARARFILAASLLFVLTAFALIWFRHVPIEDVFFGGSQQLTIEQSSRFANQFALTFLVAQMAVLVLLTPAYAAGSISEEKEKKTFIYLLMSDLTSREILVGKFLGRLVFVIGVMLAGLPILALAMLFGGISLTLLLVSYIVTLATVVMVTAISVAAACATETFRGAMFRSYGIVTLLVFLGAGLPHISPFAILFYLNEIGDGSLLGSLILGLGYSAIELGVAAFAVFLAIKWVRKMRARPLERSPRYRDDWRPKAIRKPILAEPIFLLPEELRVVELNDSSVELVLAKPLPAARSREKPPPKRRERLPPRPHVPDYIRQRPRIDENDPFLWKERYTTGLKRTADDDSIRGLFFAIGFAAAFVIAFLFLIALVSLAFDGGSGNGARVASRLLLTGGIGGFFTYILAIGSGAAGSVVRERARQTLESLLTIPVERRAILLPKWKVNIAKGWWWGLPSSATVAFGMMLGEVPLAGFACLLFVAVAIPFSASYGLWLSIRCTAITRAVLWFLPAAAALAIFPLIVLLMFDFRSEKYAAVSVLGATVLVAFLGWLFWVLALWQFEREGRS